MNSDVAAYMALVVAKQLINNQPNKMAMNIDSNTNFLIGNNQSPLNAKPDPGLSSSIDSKADIKPDFMQNSGSKDALTDPTTDKVKVIFVSIDGTEMNSQIMRNRKIGLWLKNKCTIANLDIDSINLTFRNQPIDMEKTPYELKMMNNEKVFATPKAGISKDQVHLISPNLNSLHIRILGPNNLECVRDIDRDTDFDEFFKTLCEGYKLDYNKYDFTYKDTIINKSSTPRIIGMKSGDIIKMTLRPQQESSCSIF